VAISRLVSGGTSSSPVTLPSLVTVTVLRPSLRATTAKLPICGAGFSIVLLGLGSIVGLGLFDADSLVGVVTGKAADVLDNRNPVYSHLLLTKTEGDSVSTSQLMVDFYQAESSNRSRYDGNAVALRGAALQLMKNQQFRHPFYWAGFVLIGSNA